MQKSELLKMRKGIYLLTDSICNYTYILHKTDKEGHVALLYNTLSQVGSIHIHYGLIPDFDDEFDRHTPFKRFDCSASVGGISINQKGYYGVLNELQLVGIYTKGEISKDIKKFSLNHKINMNRYDKKRFKRIR